MWSPWKTHWALALVKGIREPHEVKKKLFWPRWIGSTVTLPTELRGRTEKVGDDLGGERIFSLPRVVPWFPLLGLTPSVSFMGFTQHLNLHFRVNSLFHPAFVFIVLRDTTFICTLTFSSPRFTTWIVLCSTIQEYYCRGFQLVLTDLKVLFRSPAHEDDNNNNNNKQ